MADKLGPRARQRLAELEGLSAKVQSLHGKVERFAAERNDLDPHVTALRRSFTQLKLELAGMGLDSMAQVCAGLEMATRRGGSQPFKSRVLREGIGSLRMQLDVQQRVARSDLSAGRVVDAKD